MAQGDVKRSERVAERVRTELSEMFMRGALRDPRARGVIISAVRVTGDLSIARVYVRQLDEQPGARSESLVEARRQALLESLDSARGHLRRRLGAKLKLRRTPELHFFWDDVVDSGGRMESLLAEIASEATTEEEVEAPAPDEDGR